MLGLTAGGVVARRPIAVPGRAAERGRDGWPRRRFRRDRPGAQRRGRGVAPPARLSGTPAAAEPRPADRPGRRGNLTAFRRRDESPLRGRLRCRAALRRTRGICLTDARSTEIDRERALHRVPSALLRSPGRRGRSAARRSTPTLSATSVSGLSSGAYMAGQFHVAFSGSLIGAGDRRRRALRLRRGIARLRPAALHGDRPRRRPIRRHRWPRAAAPRRRRRHRPAGRAGGRPRLRLLRHRGPHGHAAGRRCRSPTSTAWPACRTAQIAVVDDMAAGHAFVTESEGNPCGDDRARRSSTTATTTRPGRS